MPTEYLFAVQDSNGREVVAWQGPAKVSAVTASSPKPGQVVIKAGDRTVAKADDVDPAAELTLHRWRADDKLAAPVSRPLKADS